MAPKRTKEESGARIGQAGKFEGEFKVSKNPAFLAKRLEVWKRLLAVQKEADEKKAAGGKKIEVLLPSGDKKEGVSFKTTPLDIALGISKSLANSVCVAKVTYTEKIKDDVQGDFNEASLSDSEDEEEVEEENPSVYWDLHRPLEGSCTLELVKFDHPKGAEAYWHSSAHVLGMALEKLYGGHLCIGPPLEAGFYYDIYVGNKKIVQDDFVEIEKAMMDVAKQAEPFERLVLTKEEALELFADNPFKVQLISNKIPDGSVTSAYRCGTLIDLCRGPHLPNTDRIKSALITKNSSAYWLGKSEFDSLQRVYGITFPQDKDMKAYKKMLEEAAERDHRNVGTKQELFFFHPTVSPGSCFWMPHGAKLYNTLIEFIRREYRIRDFQEVISPNIYAKELFQYSGHYQNYKDCMYGFDVEGQEWFLKPMNCPGHCMIFDHRVRSYKELPLRMASFGVLHRNELSGTLSGLTRVRRFQQDDAHIFCRMDQILAEVKSALNFLYYVYEVFGFEFTIALSTRPKKAIGDRAVWDKAEAALKEALNDSGREWTLNPGDGAFYGPKIDIRLTDALRRRHQCGTIQLDFQLPIRFGLQYRSEFAEDEEADKEEKGTAEEEAAKKAAKKEEKKGAAKAEKEAKKDAKKDDKRGSGEATKEEVKKEEEQPADDNAKKEFVWKEKVVKAGFERPVIIHRAILGSVERMVAILTEHYAGKWPFWLSPRQIMVIPVSAKYNEYGQYVRDTLHNFGFHAMVDLSGNTLNKKIRNGQIAQYNYMAVVGEREEENLSVCLRERSANKDLGVFPLQALVEKLVKEAKPTSVPQEVFESFKGKSPVAAAPAPEPAAAPAAAPAPASNSGAKRAAFAAKKSESSLNLRKPANIDLDHDLEEHLAQFPYVGGFAPTAKDRELFASVHEVPSTPMMARWFDHMGSFSATEREAWAAA